jgi:glycosyltransferase involved in cell wall biosynthesis
VHNGIDAAPFDAVSDASARACRAELGIAPGVPVVVHAGRFHHWKGQQVLLEALVHERRPVACFVGAPLFGEDAFAAGLRAEAERLGVSDRVRWLGFRDDVARLMRAADVVVHSSVYPEPFGRVVVEAMLARTPVVAARAGGVPEIVTDGETGWLVTPGDPVALAVAIGEVLDDPARAQAVAARANADARERFTRDAMVRGVRAALVSLDRA